MVTAVAPVVPPFATRLRRAAGALVALSRDKGRLDQVLVFAMAVNMPVLAKRIERLGSDAEGARLFDERPRIDRRSVDFAALERLPDGTLGREYARFLTDNGISPEPFEVLPDVGDERAAYAILRLRQTHDLWHVLTGYTPDVSGEVLLQAFTFAQLGLPSAFLLCALGTLRYLLFRRGHFPRLVRAYRRGKAARFLATFRWEEHWATPVAELRTALACPA
jgi:ubiquinone biosynthesis protein COQ4